MKVRKIALFMSLLFLIGLSLEGYAQVTIGSNLSPNSGSLLDLKQYDSGVGNTNSNKGLLLPRVKLTTEADFDPLVSGLSQTDLLTHTGLIVYHVGSVSLCAGIYTWNGGSWVRLMDPCIVEILCGTATINGTYEVGVPLNSANTITLDIEVPYLSKGGTYRIYTDTQNGMTFSATGNLVQGVMTITLVGSGMPLSGGAKTVFTIKAEFSNSSSSGTCQVELPANEIPIAKPSILGFGYAANVYGYHLESSGSKSMAGASVNFGTAANSKVKSKPIAITYNLNIDLLTTANFISSTAFKSDPDIMIHGFHSHITTPEVVDSLVSYLERGGVLILQDEYGTGGAGTANSISYRLAKKLFPNEAASISYQTLGGPGSVYTVSSTVDDEITNGPFGNLKGKNWGEDSSTAFGLGGLPADSIVVYSSGSYISPGGVSIPTYSNTVTMFRHKRLNLFIVTDGGFNSNASNYIGDSYGSRTACPFAMNVNYEPIPRINWGYGGNYTVYNSQLFANVLAWAVRHARSNNLK